MNKTDLNQVELELSKIINSKGHREEPEIQQATVNLLLNYPRRRVTLQHNKDVLDFNQISFPTRASLRKLSPCLTAESSSTPTTLVTRAFRIIPFEKWSPNSVQSGLYYKFNRVDLITLWAYGLSPDRTPHPSEILPNLLEMAHVEQTN